MNNTPVRRFATVVQEYGIIRAVWAAAVLSLIAFRRKGLSVNRIIRGAADKTLSFQKNETAMHTRFFQPTGISF